MREEPKPEREIDEEAAVHGQLLAGLPGGASLISHLGGSVPQFGDAIMREICLSTSWTSSVRFWLAGSNLTKDSKNVVVTFDIAQVLDMNLDFFGGNVMLELLLRRPIIRPERAKYLQAFADSDLEFNFHSSAGMGGFIVARGVTLHWRPE